MGGMETNILGLPSLTGYTPLKASSEGQVLKYDFKEIGPIVVDKSGNGNRGTLKPLWPTNSPKRRIASGFPLEVNMVFDGKDDYIEGPDLDLVDNVSFVALIEPSLNFSGEFTPIGKWGGAGAEPGGYIFRVSYNKPNNPIELWFLGDEHESGDVGMKTDVLQGIGATYSSDRGEIRYFRNGERVATVRETRRINPTDVTLKVGERGKVENGSYSKGSMRRVEIYDTLLSDEKMREKTEV